MKWFRWTLMASCRIPHHSSCYHLCKQNTWPALLCSRFGHQLQQDSPSRCSLPTHDPLASKSLQPIQNFPVPFVLANFVIIYVFLGDMGRRLSCLPSHSTPSENQTSWGAKKYSHDQPHVPNAIPMGTDPRGGPLNLRTITHQLLKTPRLDLSLL